jgi:uncharacterized linocin/CFP29 family protein
MDDRNAQVGWTEAQWNRVREEVLSAWQRVRVAGSFLRAYGPLPPSTQVVPSEVLKDDGTVDEQATAVVLEISLPVTLTRQQVREDDLSSALLQFRRRATHVGLLEDWYVFNGIHPSDGLPARAAQRSERKAELPSYLPAYSFLDDLVDTDPPFVTGPPKPIADQATQELGLRQRNPGALGLIEGAGGARDNGQSRTQITGRSLSGDDLLKAVVQAMDTLEKHGYVAPYACVFGRRPFEAAHQPVGGTIAFPRDRLEPLIGRELLHASAIDVPPREPAEYREQIEQHWQKRGVLLSLAGDAVDVAIAAEATPEFRQVDAGGRYVFSVFERFTLRIKDPRAIVALSFEEPSGRILWDRKPKPPQPERRPGRRSGLLGLVPLPGPLRRRRPQPH